MLAAFSLSAQVTSTVSGSVVDATGAAVPEAAVSLQLAGANTALFTAKTTPAGDFTIPSVPPNTYDLFIEAKGFQKTKISGVIVNAGRAAAIPAIKLEVSGVIQTVEVSEAQTAVETSNAEVSTTIAKMQIANLPVLNRSPLAFLTTQAGINYGAGSTTVNGQRPTYVNVTIDGINIQDNYIRTNDMDFLPNLLLLDQVAEVTVSTSNASSSASGGSSQVQFVTPSGSNAFRGAAYWSNRNNAFAANTWFNNKSGTKIPFLNQNQAGGTLGGPVIKDKLFFYANYEAFRLKQQSTYNTTILTDTARKGDFIYKDSAGNTQRGNVLSLMGVQADPSMAALIAKTPTAVNNNDLGDSTAGFSRNTAGYRYNIRNNRTRDNLTLNGNYQMSPRNNFRLTYMWNRDILDRPDVATTFDLAPTVQNDNSTKLMAATWRTTPSARLTNELRFGFNWAPAIFLASQDIPKFYVSLPSIGNALTNPINTFRTQGRNTDTYNFADNVGWVRDKHTITFGYQQQNVRIETYNDAGITPTYTIALGANPALVNTQLPGISATDLSRANSLLATLAGYVSAYTQTFNVSSRTSGFVNGYTNMKHLVNDDFALYVNDTWKLSRRLTATIGVRWDYWAPINERDGLYLAPALLNNNPISTVFNPNATLDFVGGPTGNLYKRDVNNFAPNFGLAWDPTGAGKWSVRAGYSIAYVNDNLVTAVANSVNTNTGLQQTVTASGLAARIASAPAIAAPAFKVPRTLAENYAVNTSAAMGFPSPDLVTPYVQQWNLDIQRTIKSTLIDVRYVGNHQTKALRAIDYNQVNINQLLPDFLRAQSNGFIALKATGTFNPAYNANLTGSQVLNFFPLLPSGGRLTDGTVISNIQTGQVGELANYYQTGRFNGNYSFYNNPNILGGNVLTNYSNTSYNALVVDITHRFSKGFQFQGNYVYSRTLGDAQGDQQTNFEPFLDINNAKIERSRPYAYDNTHVFKFNGYWELPFGKGHRLNTSKPFLSKVIEGWNMAGVFTEQSGNAFGIYSVRGTLNRAGRSTYNTMNTNLTKSQLDQLFQFRMTGNGPMFVPDSVKYVDGSAVAPDGSANFAGQAFFMPGAGTLGQLQRNYFSGPWVNEMDLKIGKITHIDEKKTIELRMNAVNILNHPTFNTPVTTPTASNFGAITSTFAPGSGYTRRLIQFELYFRF
jgi:Carboxypeptidase regulatory-like domain/TonB dependent receptor-like, beta-barrel